MIAKRNPEVSPAHADVGLRRGLGVPGAGDAGAVAERLHLVSRALDDEGDAGGDGGGSGGEAELRDPVIVPGQLAILLGLLGWRVGRGGSDVRTVCDVLLHHLVDEVGVEAFDDALGVGHGSFLLRSAIGMMPNLLVGFLRCFLLGRPSLSNEVRIPLQRLRVRTARYTTSAQPDCWCLRKPSLGPARSLLARTKGSSGRAPEVPFCGLFEPVSVFPRFVVGGC